MPDTLPRDRYYQICVGTGVGVFKRFHVPSLLIPALHNHYRGSLPLGNTPLSSRARFSDTLYICAYEVVGSWHPPEDYTLENGASVEVSPGITILKLMRPTKKR